MTGLSTAYKVCLLLPSSEHVRAAGLVSLCRHAAAASDRYGPLSFVCNVADNSAIPIENAPAAPFDAVMEFVFDNADKAEGFFTSRDFAESGLGAGYHLHGPILTISGQATRVWQGSRPAATDTVKIVTLPVRRPGMDMATFSRHWLSIHAGLALANAITRDRLVQLASTPADRRQFADMKPADFDGMGVIQFVDREGFDAEFASDHYRDVMAPDEPRFTDIQRSRAMMVREMAEDSRR